MKRYVLLGMAAAAVLFAAINSCVGSSEVQELVLSDLVPGEAEGWSAADDGNLYDKEGIFRYMNGAGEVYLSYAYRRLFVREFAKDGQDNITVEIFDMGTPADAFGVFTRGRMGGPADIGQGSAYDTGYLLFWKDKYFGSIYTFRETDDSKTAILALGRAIAGAIPGEGALPDILALLPEKGMVPDSARYFHLHTCLNHHYFLSDENILGLGKETEAALADYRDGDKTGLLLLVRYPDETRAASAYESFMSIYLPEGRSAGMAKLENGKWTGATRKGSYLAVVFDATAGILAEDLLASAVGKMEGEKYE
jgi:hypothetical protein